MNLLKQLLRCRPNRLEPRHRSSKHRVPPSALTHWWASLRIRTQFPFLSFHFQRMPRELWSGCAFSPGEVNCRRHTSLCRAVPKREQLCRLQPEPWSSTPTWLNLCRPLRQRDRVFPRLLTKSRPSPPRTPEASSQPFFSSLRVVFISQSCVTDLQKPKGVFG